METYTSGQVAALFQVTTETVRVWSHEFSPYLSVNANPGNKRNRRFTEDDLAVFALVAEMKAIGKTFQDAHIALQSGQRGDFPDLSPDTLATISGQDIRAITAQVQRLQNDLQMVKQERDALLAKLEEMRHLEIENATLRSERDSERRRADLSEERVKELTNRLIELQMESGQARGELAAMLRLLKMRGAISDEEE